MLIEFNVSNYRSLQDKQIFTMVADKDSSHQDTNCFPSGIPAIPKIVRVAALYGPNASGKSNLIAALSFMKSVVENSAVGIREGQRLNVLPFLFDKSSANKPSEFEITFIDEGIRYQYGFVLDATHIIREWLLVYKERKAQCWFQREYNSVKKKDDYHFSSHLSGGKQRHLWSESTRSNALFLSAAVNLNSEQLRPIFNWFINKLVIIESNMQLLPFHTMECIKNGINKEHIIQFLQAADLGITDVEVKMQKRPQVKLHVELGKVPVEIKEEVDIPNATFFHKGTSKNLIGLDLSLESHGTQRLFAYAGHILDVLRDGKVLVIDELDSSLHPKMVRFLINLIQSDSNKNNSQLIFTTHNTSLLDNDLFRRDQIWFIEKNKEQASHLYPLTDFSPRKEEALEKGYLMGRYGALPFFGDLKI